MSLEIVPLRQKHLADAAACFTARYRAARQQVPTLPGRYEDAGAILPLLHDLAGKVPGVAAIRGGRLVGFLLGMILPSFRGKRGVFSPEWANAADPESSREIYSEMYAQLSARWVAEGCVIHALSLLAHDRAGIDGWHWLGFGLAAADAVRDTSPVQGPIADVDVRRAGPQDIERVVALNEALERHLCAAPTFLVTGDDPDAASHQQQWLADPVNATWLADRGREAVAYLRIGPASQDACTIIRDEKTASIVGAFTRESARGRGIAAALLDRSLDWARSKGYERCAVDFEPMNVLAARFWTRHFQPICFAQIRHLDERIIPSGNSTS